MQTLLRTCVLILAVVLVHSLTRVEYPSTIHKRAASPQAYQGQPNASAWNQSQQFQWVKVNNQWVRRDGVSLPGYSQANVPYNQTANQWRTPAPNRSSSPSQPSGANSWNAQQRPGNQSASGWGQQPSQRPPQQPVQQPSLQRQNSSTSQGGLGWNPAADRALTQDLPRTTPRPAYTTTPYPVRPQTPPPAYNPPAATPPARAPFGSGIGTQQRPQGQWNPDMSLTYATGRRDPPPNRNAAPTPARTNAGRPGSDPYGGIFN